MNGTIWNLVKGVLLLLLPLAYKWIISVWPGIPLAQDQFTELIIQLLAFIFAGASFSKAYFVQKNRLIHKNSAYRTLTQYRDGYLEQSVVLKKAEKRPGNGRID